MKIKKVVIRSTIIVAILICLVGFLIAVIPARMTEQHTNDIIKLYFEDTGFDEEGFTDRWEIYTEEIISPLGYSIPVYCIEPDSSKNLTVILVHWHESNHKAMYPLADIFLKRGWNVVLYDQRSHGENTAPTVSFGYLESSDLGQVVKYTSERFEGASIGLMGQSMGAATIGYYLGFQESEEYLSFAVMDSTYSTMYDEIAWEITKGNVPVVADAVASLGSAFSKLFYGYHFEDVSIVDQISTSNIPTLILHSKVDRKCPYNMGKEVFDAIPHDKKSFVSFDNSVHLFSFWDEPERYSQELFDFINEYIDVE